MSRLIEKFPDEDPLACLPRKPVQDFARKRVIYDSQQRTEHLYVVISGRVKVSHTAPDGNQTVIRIVAADGFFGESALLGSLPDSESAVALENVKTMCWTTAEIEQQIEREPRLGLALVQYLVRQSIELQDRIQAMAVCKTPERVMIALAQLAESLGTRQDDGATRIGALTHHTLAEFVGTSREIVTFQLNRLRRLGMLRYSRKDMDIYVPAMLDALREADVTMPRPRTVRAGAAGQP
jgi:CRP/FNR family transcriptional regulator